MSKHRRSASTMRDRLASQRRVFSAASHASAQVMRWRCACVSRAFAKVHLPRPHVPSCRGQSGEAMGLERNAGATGTSAYGVASGVTAAAVQAWRDCWRAAKARKILRGLPSPIDRDPGRWLNRSGRFGPQLWSFVPVLEIAAAARHARADLASFCQLSKSSTMLLTPTELERLTTSLHGRRTGAAATRARG